jgi:hypothetical protein
MSLVKISLLVGFCIISIALITISIVVNLQTNLQPDWMPCIASYFGLACANVVTFAFLRKKSWKWIETEMILIPFITILIMYGTAFSNLFDPNAIFLNRKDQLVDRIVFIPLLERRIIFPKEVRARIPLNQPGDSLTFYAIVRYLPDTFMQIFKGSPEGVQDSVNSWFRLAYSRARDKLLNSNVLGEPSAAEVLSQIANLSPPAITYRSDAIQIVHSD